MHLKCHAYQNLMCIWLTQGSYRNKNYLILVNKKWFCRSGMRLRFYISVRQCQHCHPGTTLWVSKISVTLPFHGVPSTGSQISGHILLDRHTSFGSPSYSGLVQVPLSMLTPFIQQSSRVSCFVSSLCLMRFRSALPSAHCASEGLLWAFLPCPSLQCITPVLLGKAYGKKRVGDP